MVKNSIISLCLIFCFNVEAGRADQALVPLLGVPDFTSGRGWSAGVGLKLDLATVYRGSKDYSLSIKPEGAIQWRGDNYVLFWEGFDLNHTEFGGRILVDDSWLLESGLRHEIVIPSSSSEAAGLNVLPHRGSHILGFLEAKYSIDDQWGNWVSTRLILGASLYGFQARVSAGHTFFDLGSAVTEVVLYSTFADKSNVDNYFGVSESDAELTGLETSDLSGGYRSSGLDIVYRKSMSERLDLTAKVGVEFYRQGISESDLVTDDSEVGAELSAIWAF